MTRSTCFSKTTFKRSNAFYFEFLPKGIATSNNQTARLLREGILGYQDVFDY